MLPFQAIQNIITGLRAAGSPITTVAIIQGLTGHYSISHGTPAANSPNARFGKELRRNEFLLGIHKTHSGIIMIKGHPTTTAYWS